jgi:hypothetical protein
VIQIEPSFFGIALVPAPDHREVLVDPDQDAARVGLTPVPAPDDDERLLVLGAHRVQDLLERVRARLPVGEDHGDGVRVVLGRLDGVRQPARDRPGAARYSIVSRSPE